MTKWAGEAELKLNYLNRKEQKWGEMEKNKNGTKMEQKLE